nr:polysaccharide pyruvyl transferase family protein [uncultured Erythrobacter sp.]
MTNLESKQEAPKKIAFVGTFDVANYGDCLFPVVYKHLLEERLSGLEFGYYSPTSKPAEIMDYGPIKALPETVESVEFEEDALILCGGEALWIGHSSGTYNFPRSTLSAFARLWLGPTVAASRGSIDFFVHSAGAPHARLEVPAGVVGALSSATGVSVRDEVTARRLGNRFSVQVDPIFALSTILTPQQWEREVQKWLPEGFAANRYLAAHVSAPYLMNDLRDWCEQVADVAKNHKMPILMVPVCHFMDDHYTLETARQILIATGVDARQIQSPPDQSRSVIATAALLGMSGGVITSSLHACVTAAAFGTPFAVYAGKDQEDGKHRQTLLAAGIDYGIARDMLSIATTFANSVRRNREAVRQKASALALQGIDQLADKLAIRHEQARSLSQEAIDAVLLHDTAPTRQLHWETKRTILRWLQKSDFLAKLLVSRHRARLRRGVF